MKTVIVFMSNSNDSYATKINSKANSKTVRDYFVNQFFNVSNCITKENMQQCKAIYFDGEFHGEILDMDNMDRFITEFKAIAA